MKKQTVLRTRVLPLSLIVSALVSGNATSSSSTLVIDTQKGATAITETKTLLEKLAEDKAQLAKQAQQDADLAAKYAADKAKIAQQAQIEKSLMVAKERQAEKERQETLHIAEKIKENKANAQKKLEEKTKEKSDAEQRLPILKDNMEKQQQALASANSELKTLEEKAAKLKKENEESKTPPGFINIGEQELKDVLKEIDQINELINLSNEMIKNTSGEIANEQNKAADAETLINEAKQNIKSAESSLSNTNDFVKEMENEVKELKEKKELVEAQEAKATAEKEEAEKQQQIKNELKIETEKQANEAQQQANKEKVTTIVTKVNKSNLTAKAGTYITVNKDASTLDAKINGGTQKVLTGGVAKGSVITDDGKVELETGSLAENTVVENGTLTNDSGTDIGTVVLADGKYILTGSAVSENAVIYGNEATLYSGDYTVDPNALNPGVLITDQAQTKDMTINTRAMAMLNSKDANMSNTQVSGMLYNEAGTDTGTNILAGGVLIVNGTDALSVNANIAKGGEAAVVNGATANNMVSTGKIIAADGGIINSLTMHGGSFDLLDGAQARDLKTTRGMVKAFGSLNGAELHESALNIANNAMVSGALKADKSSIINIAAGANTASTDLTLAGQMTFFAAEPEEATGLRTKRSIARAAAVPQSPQHSFKSVVLNGGTVDLTQAANNTQLKMGTLSGKGHFKLNTLSNATGAPIQVIGKADGSFDIEIQDSGATPTNLNVIQTGSGSNASFKLNRKISQGNYRYDLIDNGNGTFRLVADISKLTASTAGILAMANTSPVIFNAELSSVNNRLDRLATFSHEDGLWLTYLNNSFKVNGTATNFNQTLNGVTLGADKTAEMDNGSMTLGGFFSHSNSSIKTDYQSSGKVDSYALGAYALYQHRSGYFVNGVLKGNQFSQDVNVEMRGADTAKGNARFTGLGLAIKAGKNIGHGALTVTPYAGISGFNGFDSDYQLSNGMKAQSKGNRSVIGTVGVNTGYQINLKNGVAIKPYTTLSVDQEFAKGNKMVINNEQFSNDLSGTRANVGLGMNAQLSKNVSVTSEVKFAKGKNISSPVTVNAGISYSF
ncbi:autotransporter outer membrane beta-barrel domain-containing protein [Yersinia alsatica]|uniref:autotransporter outer membrane beta-barrel domain-containing protein n=1 Tax=Yersinia alsatica TaxID=2890317 RepID=UPI0011A4AF65|nr:autotransporter outer membrane beta-barrel domain-containing protein [Yersinia alsatica]